MVSKCTKIQNDFVNQTKSIKTNGYCVKLYSNEICTSDGNINVSIALGEGTPLHEDLHSSWQFRTTKSISHCNYACPRQSRMTKFPAQGEIFIFENTSYRGLVSMINDINGNCKDIPNEMTELTNSIQIGDNTCVLLFNQKNCFGESYVLNISIPEWKQKQSIQSIKECLIKTTVSTTNSVWETSTTPESNFKIPEKRIPDENEYVEEKPISLVYIIVIGSLSVVALLSSLFVARCVTKKCHANHKASGGISERDVRDFFNGCDIDITATKNNSVRILDEGSTELQAQNRPYNKKYDVSCSRIEYG